MRGFIAFVLFAGLLGALFAAAGAAQRNDTIRLRWVDPVITSVEDDMLSSGLVRSQLRPPYSKTVLIDLWRDDVVGDRSAPVREADRRTITDLIDALRAAPGRPAAVILDIDLAPRASGLAEQADAIEARLAEALSAWNQLPDATPLLLARGEGCMLPPSATDEAVRLTRLMPTPYDAAVGGGTGGVAAGHVAWTCVIPVVWRDGLVRGFEPVGCATAEADGSARFPVPSPAVWLEALAGSPDKTLSEVYAVRRADWARACKTRGVPPADRLPLPVVLGDEDWAADNTVVWRAAGGSLPDVTGALVVIGQTHPRAGDRWEVPRTGRIPGVNLVARHVDTILGAPGRLKPAPWLAALIAAGFGMVAGAIYYGLRRLRGTLSTVRAKAWRWPAYAGQLILSPPFLFFLLFAILAPILHLPLVAFLEPQFWGSIWSAIAGAMLSLVILDVFLLDDPVPGNRQEGAEK